MYNAFYDVSIHTAVKGTEDLPRHSEGTIIELKDKSLLLAWQRYEKSDVGSGDHAPSTISMMNSYDGGKTWENFRIVAQRTPDCVNLYSPSLYRCSDGSLSLLFKRYLQLAPRQPRIMRISRMDSYDEGKTWSEETDLWDQVNFTPINHAVKRSNTGATLIPLNYFIGGWCSPDETHQVSVLRSEDDMRSFTESNKLDLPMRGPMEPCIAQQANGKWTMVMRTQLGSVFKSESLDDGRTWSKPQTTGLHAPESCPCVATIPGTDVQIVVWNNSEYDMYWRSHYGKRTPLTMALSRDGLRTFTDFYDIETDPERGYSNPTLSFTEDGLCILTYFTMAYAPKGYMVGPADLKVVTFRVKI